MATILDLPEEILREIATYLSSEHEGHDVYSNAQCFVDHTSQAAAVKAR